ncbi:MAG: 1-acyl-sn-glycerol-3-phosphate acyltransferase [Phycisphaerales bacterium]|nr:1-acyl-sn-glycerol-3-phosphate acyltransferase [Phycisphaerales bacterium]
MKPFLYKPARDLDLTGMDRLASPLRERGLLGAAGHGAFLASARVYLGLYHRLRVTGRSILPRVGPLVIVANHASHLDAVAILAALPARLRAVARPVSAADTFFRSLPRAGLSSLFIDALAIHRAGVGRHELGQLRERLENDGCCLVVFPEGTRTRTGEQGRFRHGVGSLVAGSPVPVVPCRIEGAHAALPPDAKWPRPSKIELRFGEPMTFECEHNAREGWRHIAETLEDTVKSLSKGGVPTRSAGM